MSDDARDTSADAVRRLREGLDHELAPLEVTDDARRRLRRGLARPTRPVRWPVPVVTATAVVVLVAVPGLVARSLRTAPPPSSGPTAVLPGRPAGTTTAPPTPRPGTTKAPGPTPAPVTGSAATHLELAVTPQKPAVGNPVVGLVVRLVAGAGPVEARSATGPTTEPSRAAGPPLAGAPVTDATTPAIPAARLRSVLAGVLTVDWGDGTSDDLRLTCQPAVAQASAVPSRAAPDSKPRDGAAPAVPSGALDGAVLPGVRQAEPLRHLYRRPGTYRVTASVTATACWPADRFGTAVGVG